MHLELRMSTFFGYGKASGEEQVQEMHALRYLGTQCHGIMWPAADHATLADWPIAPPMIAGKVKHVTSTTPIDMLTLCIAQTYTGSKGFIGFRPSKAHGWRLCAGERGRP